MSATRFYPPLSFTSPGRHSHLPIQVAILTLCSSLLRRMLVDAQLANMGLHLPQEGPLFQVLCQSPCSFPILPST
ncbi:hypothetical protein BDV41DRAFT_534776 [Aspergillus transmontanensis]|uniref:Uncharacterized protein n=1 Tax=Aspergillus transmontanensis TaxID=1034304 RepID=A0A5N6VZI2_9EURO|nr:hypothetical protein BDV41DRAFT_534776 [Aspergillus transmontanensis]